MADVHGLGMRIRSESMVKYGELCERLQSLILQTLVERNRLSPVGRNKAIIKPKNKYIPMSALLVSVSRLPVYVWPLWLTP